MCLLNCVFAKRVIRYSKRGTTVVFEHPFSSLWDWRWLITPACTHARTLIIACIGSLPYKTRTKIDTHTQPFSRMRARPTHTSTDAQWKLHRWRLAWGRHCTSKGHLWHLRSLTNDDAQRSFATTKAEQKNWHEREVNKHKAFNKTFFYFSAEYTTKVFLGFFFLLFPPSNDRTKRKKELSSHRTDWLNERQRSSHFQSGWACPG